MTEFLRNLRIRIKLYIGFSVIFILLLIIGFKDHEDLRNYEEQKKEIIYNLKSADFIKEGKYVIRTEMYIALNMMQASDLRQIERNWDKHLRAYEETLSTLKELRAFSRKMNVGNLLPLKKQMQNIIVSIEDDYNDIVVTSVKRIRDTKQNIIENPHKPEEEAVYKPSDLTPDISDLNIQLNAEDPEPEEMPLGIEESEVIFQLEESNSQSLFYGDRNEDPRIITLNEIYNHINATGDKMIKEFDAIQKLNKTIIRRLEADSLELAESTEVESLFIIFFGLLLSVLIAFLISNLILNPISKLSNLIYSLAAGELPDSIEVKAEDEIGDMTKGLNLLVEGLKKIARFSVEIGKGNFSSAFEPLSDKDVLGNSLLNMRRSLQQAKQDEQKRKIEDERRNWATHGMAQFGEILRHRTEGIEDLAGEIIKNLVEYLKANQGGLFIYNDKDPQFAYLELISAYAYNRKKYLDRKIRPGEGLVGMCALEKYTIHLTEIPDDYIEIESGLGLANPKSLLLVPLKMEEEIHGVIELASFSKFETFEIDLVEKIAESIASTLATLKINARTANLLEQSQKQAIDMQEQEEEMRQNMEELQATQEEAIRREIELKDKLSQLSVEFDSAKQKNITLQNTVRKLKNVLIENKLEIPSEEQ